MQFIPDNNRLDAQIIAARYLVDKATQRKDMQDKRINQFLYAVSGLIVGVYIAASYFLFG
jgi:hypothetical protein